MIVHKRSTHPRYTMAMGEADFTLLHELVRLKIEEIRSVTQDPVITPLYALLLDINSKMTHPVEK